MKKEKTIKLGDWWLLTLFFVLVVQSTYGLFFPSEAAQEVQSIDIVFRTSIAAIFGYVISTNFGRKSEGKATAQSGQVASGTIGFTTPDNRPVATLAGKREVATEVPEQTVKVKKVRKSMTNTAQLTLVGVIGLVSLLVLIIWRNTLTLGMDMDASMTSIISQFRDMVSGCVGFLIGYPQEEKTNEA